MGKIKDYTGMKFNNLTCMQRIQKNKRTYYVCECDCGNTVEIRSDSLVSGHTKTCGKCPINTYVIKDNYIVGLTSAKEEFYFDKIDFDFIKKYNWSKTSHGYIRTTIKNKTYYLHRLLLEPKEDFEVDHINRIKHDNRRVNLRLVCRSQNEINKTPGANNSSGIRGVYFDKSRNKWASQITKDGKTYSLGRYPTKEKAQAAREKKELELYGSYSPCSI